MTRHYRLKRTAEDFFDLAYILSHKIDPSLKISDPVFKQLEDDFSDSLLSTFLYGLTIERANVDDIKRIKKNGNEYFMSLLTRIIHQVEADDYATILNEYTSRFGILVSSKPIDDVNKKSVFISHTTTDKEFARKLSSILISDGIRVWIDEAEIKIGESLLQKIEKGINEIDFLLVILSNNSIKSKWVQKELEMAHVIELERDQFRILPVTIDSCQPPLSLRGKLYVDFSQPLTFQVNYERLLSIIQRKDYPCFLTAREAARLVQSQAGGPGEIISISQLGVSQKHNPFVYRGDIIAADAKTGRSRVWVFEFADTIDHMLRTFSVIDGKVVEHQVLHITHEGLMNAKIINFMFVDSDVAIKKAMGHVANKGNINPMSAECVVFMDLKFCEPMSKFAWTVSFHDIALGKQVDVTFADALNGEVIIL